MKALPWILAGVGVGLATYFVLHATTRRYAIGAEEVEGAANKTSRWGTKQRVMGNVGRAVGKIKEGIGKAAGDDSLAAEGVVDEDAGVVKDTAGKAAHAVSETMHDLNH